MADLDSLMGEIEALGGTGNQPQGPLSLGEKALGYSRSYLAGPTFNFADEAEALIASLFTGRSYSDELSQINTEQSRFKDKTDYLDNAVELFSGAALNPLQSLKALSVVKNVADPKAKLARDILLSPVGEAGVAGFGSGNTLEERVNNAAISAALGGATSAVGNIAGEGLQTLNRQAARLKTSAFKVPYQALQRQANKLDELGLQSADQLPLVQTLNKAEASGVIEAGEDLLQNAEGLKEVKKKLGNKINDFIDSANPLVAPDKNFSIPSTINYIESLSGTAKEEATRLAMKEWETITDQMKVGTLKELQNAKTGLNYTYEKNPLADTIQKFIREDLKKEIEIRVENSGLDVDRLINLNKKFGAVEELRNVFQSRGASDLTGNVVEDGFRSQATTGGQGTANIMSAQSGKPIYAALGFMANGLRVPTALSKTADIIGNPVIANNAEKIGKVIEDNVTARNTAQVFVNVDENLDREEQKKSAERTSVKDLLSNIDRLLSNSTAFQAGRDQSDERSLGTRQGPISEGQDPRKLSQLEEGSLALESSGDAKQESGSSGSNREYKKQNPSKSPTDDIFNEIEALGGGTPKAQPISYEDSLMNDLFSSGVYMQEQVPRTIKEIENEIDSDPYYSALYEAESGRNPTAKNPKSTASGGFQFIKATAKALDLKDPFDLGESFNAVRKLTGAHQEQFGDNPEVLYAAHYLGQTLLSKWKRGVELKPNEQALVKSLQDKALPRFRRIYNKVLERNRKSQITEA